MVCEVFFQVIEFENNSLNKKRHLTWFKMPLFFWNLPNFRAYNSLFLFFRFHFPRFNVYYTVQNYHELSNYLCNSLSVCDMVCLVIILYTMFFFPSNRWGSLRWSEVPFPNGWWWSLWDGWRLGFDRFQTFRGWDGEMDQKFDLLPLPFSSRCEVLVEHVATNRRTTLKIYRVCWQLVGGNSSFG